MKRVGIFILLLFLVGVVTASCENKAEKIANARKLMNEKCSKCHFSDKVYTKKYTKEDWKTIMDRMVNLSKDNPQKEKIEISHEDAYEILLLLQEESGD